MPMNVFCGVSEFLIMKIFHLILVNTHKYLMNITKITFIYTKQIVIIIMAIL